VYELSRFLANGDDKLRASLAHCLRDSWRMIYGGVLFLNHNLMSVPNTTAQHSQCIDQVRYVSNMLINRAQSRESSSKLPEIYIISLGSDGAAAHKELASSVSKLYKVRGWRGKHPAYIYRLPERRQLVTPMLPEPARKYLREKLLSAAKRSVMYCDIVVKEGPEYRVAALYNQKSRLSMPVACAGGSMQEAARALLPEYPKPVLCSPGVRDFTLLDGAEDNDLGTEIQRLRDSMFVEMYLSGAGEPTSNSYAVEALTMAYRNNRSAPAAATLDADTIGRLVGGVQTMSTNISSIAHESQRVHDALESLSPSGHAPGASLHQDDMPTDVAAAFAETKTALKALTTACQAACGNIHLFRVRMMAAGHHEAISRPRPSTQAELIPSREVTSPPTTIPANTSPVDFSPPTSPPSSASVRPVMRKLNRNKAVITPGAPQAPASPQTQKSDATPSIGSSAPSLTSSPKTPTPKMRPINRSAIRMPPSVQPTGEGQPVNLHKPESSSSPSAGTSGQASLEFKAGAPRSLSLVAHQVMAGAETTGPKIKVGNTPFMGSTDSKPDHLAVEIIEKSVSTGPSLPAAVGTLTKDIASAIASWADAHKRYTLGDAIAVYLDSGLIDGNVRPVCALVEGLGESATLATIEMALSASCPPRLKYIVKTLESL
jgi:hypothetical protein